MRIEYTSYFHVIRVFTLTCAYIHQLSLSSCARILIALAVKNKIKFIILDEMDTLNHTKIMFVRRRRIVRRMIFIPNSSLQVCLVFVVVFTPNNYIFPFWYLQAVKMSVAPAANFFKIFKSHEGKRRVPYFGICSASWESNGELSWPATNNKAKGLDMLLKHANTGIESGVKWKTCPCKLVHTNIATYDDAKRILDGYLLELDSSATASTTDVEENQGRSRRRPAAQTAASIKDYDVLLSQHCPSVSIIDRVI